MKEVFNNKKRTLEDVERNCQNCANLIGKDGELCPVKK